MKYLLPLLIVFVSTFFFATQKVSAEGSFSCALHGTAIHYASKSIMGCPNPVMESGSVIFTDDSFTCYARMCQSQDTAQLSLETHTGGTYEGSVEEGAIPNTGKAIAGLLTNPPASANVYFADLLMKVNPNLVPEAYAQGTGFGALNPILPLWKVTRNIAYLFFIVVFVIVGFSIMFRAQINPQTVITVERALPGLVITLLLVTFSYPIAGFLVDLMYLIIYLIISLFGQNVFVSTNLYEIAIEQNIFANYFSIVGTVGLDAAGSVANVVNGMFGAGTVAGVVGGLVGGGLGFAAFAFVVFFQSFRMFFILLTAYFMFLVEVIFAPLTLLLNAIPGSNGGGLVGYLKRLAKHLVVFPAIIVLIFLAYALTGNQTRPGVANFTQGGFQAPQLVGSGTAGNLLGILGIGAIIVGPSFIKSAQSMFGDTREDTGSVFASALGSVGANRYVSAANNLATYGLASQTSRLFPQDQRENVQGLMRQFFGLTFGSGGKK